MTHLINKDALVAEIERRLWLLVPKMTFHQQRVELEKLLSFLDTIEVKEVQEEPVSEDLEEASKEWLRPQLDKSYANYGEVKMMELTHFDGYAMLDAIEFGAKWGRNQAMAEIQAQSMALAHGCPIDYKRRKENNYD